MKKFFLYTAIVSLLSLGQGYASDSNLQEETGKIIKTTVQRLLLRDKVTPTTKKKLLNRCLLDLETIKEENSSESQKTQKFFLMAKVGESLVEHQKTFATAKKLCVVVGPYDDQNAGIQWGTELYADKLNPKLDFPAEIEKNVPLHWAAQTFLETHARDLLLPRDPNNHQDYNVVMRDIMIIRGEKQHGTILDNLGNKGFIDKTLKELELDEGGFDLTLFVSVHLKTSKNQEGTLFRDNYVQ